MAWTFERHPQFCGKVAHTRPKNNMLNYYLSEKYKKW
jgi:hypothetical protein